MAELTDGTNALGVSTNPLYSNSIESGTWNVGLNAGTNTVGAVNQGTGGTSPWEVNLENSIPTGTNTIGAANQGNGLPSNSGNAWMAGEPSGSWTASLSAAGQSLLIHVNGQTWGEIQITGTYSGTIIVYENGDSFAYSFPAQLYQLNTSSGTISNTSPVTSITNSDVVYAFPIYGINQLQVYMSSYTSGTADVNVTLGNTVFGTPSQPMWAELTDGTNALGVSTNPLYSNSIESGTWNVGLNAGTNTVGAVNQGTGGTSPWEVNLENSIPTGTNTIGSVTQGNGLPHNDTNAWMVGEPSGQWTGTFSGAGQSLNIPVNGQTWGEIQVTGTYVGQITLYENGNAFAYAFPARLYQMTGNGTFSTNVSQNNITNTDVVYGFPLYGVSQLQVYMGGYTSGTADVSVTLGNAVFGTPTQPMLTQPDVGDSNFHSDNFDASTTATTVAAATGGVDWGLISFSCFNSSSISNDYVEISSPQFFMYLIPPPGSDFIYTPSIPIPGGVGNAWQVNTYTSANYINCTASFEELQP